MVNNIFILTLFFIEQRVAIFVEKRTAVMVVLNRLAKSMDPNDARLYQLTEKHKRAVK